MLGVPQQNAGLGTSANDHPRQRQGMVLVIVDLCSK